MLAIVIWLLAAGVFWAGRDLHLARVKDYGSLGTLDDIVLIMQTVGIFLSLAGAIATLATGLGLVQIGG